MSLRLVLPPPSKGERVDHSKMTVKLAIDPEMVPLFWQALYMIATVKNLLQQTINLFEQALEGIPHEVRDALEGGAQVPGAE